MLLLSGIIKHTCEGYKGSVLIEPEQAIEKADYKCGKSFYLDPILDTYKKKIIENPIVDKILDMIAKANIDRLDFGLKKITNNHSHVVFTNEDKYQNYKPDPDSKTKIIYGRKLFQYGDMVGLDIIKVKPPKKCIYKNCPKPPKTGYQNADISRNPIVVTECEFGTAQPS